MHVCAGGTNIRSEQALQTDRRGPRLPVKEPLKNTGRSRLGRPFIHHPESLHMDTGPLIVHPFCDERLLIIAPT